MAGCALMVILVTGEMQPDMFFANKVCADPANKLPYISVPEYALPSKLYVLPMTLVMLIDPVATEQVG